METLKLFKGEKGQETLNYDEMLQTDGTWQRKGAEIPLDRVKELNYFSIVYTYYIYESKHDVHYILRKRN